MWALVVAGTAVIAATYGLVRLAFGLHLPEMSREFGLGIATLGLISAGASVVYGLAACAGFLRRAAAFYAGYGIHIEQVMTDNAFAYARSRLFAATLADIGATHKPIKPR